MDIAAAYPITLTDAARTALDGLFGLVSRPQLRIFLSFQDASGPRLDLAPDAPTDADAVVSCQGYSLCMARLLLEQAAPVCVDCGPQGFVVHSRLDFSEAGGNCGGDCGSHH
jgi:hypothetical protein